ncbi:unnamed protein product [Echinostoma caproni]|uniref:DUF1604 domain-containing protein n=1 Tax=Echinostoma caproni TaxID=27848 RepID=A0A183AY05_9TREM|nr:unnamed protein product [Echinostoma caproni]
MGSWEDNEEGDNWITYGAAFSDDDTEDGRQRALYFGKHRPVPTAYEQRVLNEKGRPMRFHGAFTGGFSAGYFNTVGSKEGFKPRSFHSSRKDRSREADERQMVQRPEDFMDDEDFGEFGIAPRRIRMAHGFDDTHVRDSIKAALGGQSLIPVSSEFLKNLIVPSKGPLAERLLRRMGWRDSTAVLESEETWNQLDESDVSSSKVKDTDNSNEIPPMPAPCLFAKISFEAKTNTFGLGYSGLNPDVAMGRQLTGSQSNAPWDQLGDRHPEESSTALSRRQQAVQFQPGFNPHTGPSRSGIRGQAFGVSVLEVEDSDIYAQDKLADYDWEIGGGPSSAEDEDEDVEQAELEAARLGRLSSTNRGSTTCTPIQSTGKKLQSSRTIDGWTAPTNSHGKGSTGRVSVTGLLHGFTPSSDSDERARLMGVPPTIRLPPGYMPVFNPQCVRDPSLQSGPSDASSRGSLSGAESIACGTYRGRLDALSRAQILSDPSTDSVLEMVSPIEQLRMKAAAAGLPVPKVNEETVKNEGTASETSTSIPTSSLAQSLKTDVLLKPFKTDAAKQARFEAFQVLLRRGFTADPTNSDSSSHTPASRGTPLTTQLPAHKQQLVASLLASRFRSAGCMDISKELTESEEKAIRAKVEVGLCAVIFVHTAGILCNLADASL